MQEIDDESNVASERSDLMSIFALTLYSIEIVFMRVCIRACVRVYVCEISI